VKPEFVQHSQREFLDEVREGMAMIEAYVREAAQRLEIAVTSITWGAKGHWLTEGAMTYPLKVTSGSVSQTLEFPLQVLADYPGGHGYVKPTFHVDELLRAVKEALG
jgi:hypothetical protein